MWRCSHGDLTIDQVLRDPVIGAQMRADHVAAETLEALLRSLAAKPGRNKPGILSGVRGRQEPSSPSEIL